jgi:uncharacterized protein
MNFDLTITLIGLIGGLCMGLTGVGAGSVINSLLLLSFPGLSLTAIVGTSALEGTLLKTVVSWKIYQKSGTHRNQVIWMIVGALPATVFGSSVLLNWLSDLPVFRMVLYFVLALASLVIVIEAVTFRALQQDNEDALIVTAPWKLISWGVLLGLVVGATSIGTGTLMVTTLLLVLKFPVKRAISLALWSGSIILFIASITHIVQGHVDWALWLNLMLGSTPGIFAGQYLRGYIPATPLRITVALVIFYLMSRNLLSGSAIHLF